MLGVDRIVLHGGVEPQAVALLAVVEGALEGLAAPGPAASAAAAAPAPAALGPLVTVVATVVLGAARLLVLLRGGLVFLLLGLQGGRHQSVVLGPQVGLLLDHGPGGIALGGLGGGQFVLALELPDVPHGHLELMCDPRVGPPLAHPRPDLIELGLQRSSGQRARETSNALVLVVCV